MWAVKSLIYGVFVGGTNKMKCKITNDVLSRQFILIWCRQNKTWKYDLNSKGMIYDLFVRGMNKMKCKITNYVENRQSFIICRQQTLMLKLKDWNVKWAEKGWYMMYVGWIRCNVRWAEKYR